MMQRNPLIMQHNPTYTGHAAMPVKHNIHKFRDIRPKLGRTSGYHGRENSWLQQEIVFSTEPSLDETSCLLSSTCQPSPLETPPSHNSSVNGMTGTTSYITKYCFAYCQNFRQPSTTQRRQLRHGKSSPTNLNQMTQARLVSFK